MYPYNSYINQNYYNNTYTASSYNAEPVDAVTSDVEDTKVKKRLNNLKQDMNEVPYNPTFAASDLRTQLITNDEKSKYNVIQKNLDRKTKKGLDSLLKKGILLSNNSSDKSTVLDNLYKITTTTRAVGLSNTSLTKDLIDTLNNPYNITQQFGDIPAAKQKEVMQQYAQNITTTDPNIKNVQYNDINVTHSGTCVAASIEFNLAQNNPAEFARFAESLTSPANKVDKVIHLDKLADNSLDAIWLLNAFEVPYKDYDFQTATLTFKPDNGALTRAQIQTAYKDPGERTPIDVLMQSTFMQVGSQQSYNSLSDKRKGKFNQNDKGLIEFEKTFVESVVGDKNIISMTYQNIDENARLTGHVTDMDTIKRHITQTIDLGENVLIGYTLTDSNNVIINGHEITIVGYKTDPKTNKTSFICNDTDDNETKPIEYTEDYLLPKIHHAALPKSVLKDDIHLVENWVEGMNKYNEDKKQLQASSKQDSVQQPKTEIKPKIPLNTVA